jgi:RsiW-degrading membrane proteinase PrsW (M82 family)
MVLAATRYAASVLPVVVFLIALVFLDSFKLVRLRSVVLAVIIGFAAAVASFILSTKLAGTAGVSEEEARRIIDIRARYLAPPIEEFLKIAYLGWLIRTKRIGFMVDAAIYGFAIGTGFAILENVYFLHTLSSSNALLWIIRGFGTAVMHGGTTALAGIIAVNLLERGIASGIVALVPGFVLATLIHSAYNHFFLTPVLSALAIVVALPACMVAVFRRSERGLRSWLGIGFDSDQQLLEMITTGTITETRIGHYLLSLKTHFPGEAVADMLCIVRLHVELALKAKGILLMRQAGFDVKPDPGVRETFGELRYLEKNIGKTGLLALEPILHWSTRDLWQLYMLGKK